MIGKISGVRNGSDWFGLSADPPPQLIGRIFGAGAVRAFGKLLGFDLVRFGSGTFSFTNGDLRIAIASAEEAHKGCAGVRFSAGGATSGVVSLRLEPLLVGSVFIFSVFLWPVKITSLYYVQDIQRGGFPGLAARFFWILRKYLV